ncbi:MAG: hypothetical protein O7G87_21080 [bacterium]|nr:hypothetical protein [bacterium]
MGLLPIGRETVPGGPLPPTMYKDGTWVYRADIQETVLVGSGRS